MLFSHLIRCVHCLDHKDYAALMKAWDIIKGVASYVESKTEEAKNITKVLEIQSRLQGKFEVYIAIYLLVYWPCNVDGPL